MPKNIYNYIWILRKGRKNMLAKYWKKIALVILIVACVFNIMNKLVHKLSLNNEMLSSAQYVYDQQQTENSTQNNTNNENNIN